MKKMKNGHSSDAQQALKMPRMAVHPTAICTEILTTQVKLLPFIIIIPAVRVAEMHVLQESTAIVAQPGQRQRRPRYAANQMLQPHLFGLAGQIHFIHSSSSLTLISAIFLYKSLPRLRIPARDKP
ncbi:hypothetical protein [Enterobacter ludwigii]|jgi:hypothetical protein|uniref:hypothetical protein n=1 Tax=Enterobacter ludwigii TaxID=299767 RepID=UPI00130E3500|nr:hypothetical protein [Enterobacter ludwigii]